MRPYSAKKRVMILENTLALDTTSRSAELTNYETSTLMQQLQELVQEAKRIEKETEAAGDCRTALAAIRVAGRLVEVMAALRGDLREPAQTDIVVNLDPDTARKMAETYLVRRNFLEAK